MKFAAIDIGSNAVRLLLSRVIEADGQAYFKKESLVRMPVRLGEDAFVRREISKERATALVEALVGFSHLIKSYQPIDMMACATSAMREAKNGDKIVAEIREKSGIKLEIIDGKTEAELIYANHIERDLSNEEAFLYIDVGGGSTEITLFDRKKVLASRSFNIGTVRQLQGLVPKKRWNELKAWLLLNMPENIRVSAVGSGGNINRIFRFSMKKEGKPLSLSRLREINRFLKSFTYEERILRLGLKPDRADVIIPALKIYISAMKWARIKRIYVPQIGLSDGLIHIMYERHKAASKKKS